MEDNWKKVSTRCPFCNKKVIGLLRDDGVCKFICPHCKAVIYSTKKNGKIKTVAYQK